MVASEDFLDIINTCTERRCTPRRKGKGKRNMIASISYFLDVSGRLASGLVPVQIHPPLLALRPRPLFLLLVFLLFRRDSGSAHSQPRDPSVNVLLRKWIWDARDVKRGRWLLSLVARAFISLGISKPPLPTHSLCCLAQPLTHDDTLPLLIVIGAAQSEKENDTGEGQQSLGQPRFASSL